VINLQPTLARGNKAYKNPAEGRSTYNQPYLRMINLQPALARGNKAYKNPVRRVKPTINPI
jgi:hypothetical protein